MLKFSAVKLSSVYFGDGKPSHMVFLSRFSRNITFCPNQPTASKDFWWDMHTTGTQRW